MDKDEILQNLRQQPLSTGSKGEAIMCAKILQHLSSEAKTLSGELDMDEHKVLYLLVQLWGSVAD